jgi:cytochrome P450
MNQLGNHRTIFHALVRDSNLPPEQKTLKRLSDEGQLMTGAGSETTAQTLSRLFFYLKTSSPAILEKLRRELQDAFPGKNEAAAPRWADLQRLPYLTCVVREALRISGGTTCRLPRVVKEDIKYGEWVIPKGVCFLSPLLSFAANF